MTSPIVALVVEDEALIRIMVEDVLLAEKIEFVSVDTGDAAIKKLQENPGRFHVIISDIRMPGSIDGWGVGRAARKLSPNAAVIYITGDSAKQWVANGVPNSILLEKPFSDGQLIEANRSFAR